MASDREGEFGSRGASRFGLGRNPLVSTNAQGVRPFSAAMAAMAAMAAFILQRERRSNTSWADAHRNANQYDSQRSTTRTVRRSSPALVNTLPVGKHRLLRWLGGAR